MSSGRLVYLYVDNVQVGTLFTAWSLNRVLARLRSFHPNAQALEVKIELADLPIDIRPGAEHRINATWHKVSGKPQHGVADISPVERSTLPKSKDTLPGIDDPRAKDKDSHKRLNSL